MIHHLQAIVLRLYFEKYYVWIILNQDTIEKGPNTAFQRSKNYVLPAALSAQHRGDRAQGIKELSAEELDVICARH